MISRHLGLGQQHHKLLACGAIRHAKPYIKCYDSSPPSIYVDSYVFNSSQWVFMMQRFISTWVMANLLIYDKMGFIQRMVAWMKIHDASNTRNEKITKALKSENAGYVVCESVSDKYITVLCVCGYVNIDELVPFYVAIV